MRIKADRTLLTTPSCTLKGALFVPYNGPFVFVLRRLFITSNFLSRDAIFFYKRINVFTCAYRPSGPGEGVLAKGLSGMCCPEAKGERGLEPGPTNACTG